MHSIIQSGALVGVDGQPVQVEIDLLRRLPCITIVGLPDSAVRESGDRVRSAIQQSGLEFPRKRIIINLAPAGMKKQGPLFDLAIAVGIIMASQHCRNAAEKIHSSLFIGELSLSGTLKPIRGALSIALLARKQGLQRIVLPTENAAEASAIENLEVCAFDTLKEVIRWLDGEIDPLIQAPSSSSAPINTVDLLEVKGQTIPKRALEIAAAGGHNLLFIGSPGCGKSMLAMRLATILPELSFEEAIDITRIHSVAGTHTGNGLMGKRPFRAPHHSTSVAAMIGNAKLCPGEATLAHNGVLFLDELAEFRRDVLESLRSPLENKTVQLTRANGSVEFPANFSLISAANPCLCGWRHHPFRACNCTPSQIDRYRARISGPIRDRIDIHVWVHPVSTEQLIHGPRGENSNTVRARVNKARHRQRCRFINSKIHCNAELSGEVIQQAANLCVSDQHWLSSVLEHSGMSARAYSRVLKVARTIADLDDSENIHRPHLIESLSYRDTEELCA